MKSSPIGAFLIARHLQSTQSTSRSLSTPTTTMAITALDEKNPDGAFVRSASLFRSTISSSPSAPHPPASGRYHLFVAAACPWAHRCAMVRALKGLEEVIGLTYVHPVWQRTRPEDPSDAHCGWVFGEEGGTPFANTEGRGGPFPAAFKGNEPDPVQGSRTLRDLYELAGDQGGKYSVPVLWDLEKNTIVNNESSEVLRMLNSEFNKFAKHSELNLRPEGDTKLIAEIDAANEWIYSAINNGVYRCGFATSQLAYDEAIVVLTDAFDRVEDILSRRRYIAGDHFTEADVRLFSTLVRFDEVYTVYFKCNTRSVATSPVLMGYCREIYRMPGVAETINMEQIKYHYYTSHPMLNSYSIVAKGRDFVGMLKEGEHGRERVFENTPA